jgi:hypothetical protein
MAFKNAPQAWMNGVTVATADIEDSAVTVGKLAGSITNSKLTNAYIEKPIICWQGTAAAGTHLGKVQLTEAVKITEICFACSMNGTAGSTAIDLNGGPNVASAVTLFGAGAKLIIKDGSTLKVSAPSGTLGSIADNGVVWFDIDSIASGTKSNWNITVSGRVPLRTLT